VDDTIAAVSTAPGRSFLSVVRMSGPEALTIADRFVIGADRFAIDGPRPTTVKGFSAPRVRLRLRGGRVVESRMLVMRRPRSYTVEDVVEFFLPGSPPIADAVLGACVDGGARIAGPGEFTRRAFVNGRIDAVQVEAVLSLIESGSDEQRAAAMERLRGRPTRDASAARDRLLDVLAAIEAYLDFEDEDTEAFDSETLKKELASCRSALSNINAVLARRRPFGNIPGVVILGPPNAGKSSLFGALCPGREVIVSSVPGTTRDLIESEADVHGRRVRLFDAPGVMDTDDPLELLALSNLAGMMDRIGACIVLVDGSRPPDRRALADIERFRGGRPFVIALNKSDLGLDPAWKESEWAPEPCHISAAQREGLDDLLGRLKKVLPEPLGADGAAMDVGLVHSVLSALGAIDLALTGDWIGGVELVALEIREAFDALGAICGPVTGQDLLEQVFSRFCIGK